MLDYDVSRKRLCEKAAVYTLRVLTFQGFVGVSGKEELLWKVLVK
jgi:hypothetical protein